MEDKVNIINLTQHRASPEQTEEGVFDVVEEEELKDILSFTSPPSKEEVRKRAENIADIAARYNVRYAMIGGAPYLMSSLERALRSRDITPLYAFSRRESVEKIVEGKTVKTSVFKHIGFVEAC